MSFGGGGSGGGSISSSSDVALSNPSNGQVLTYNSTLGKWQNSAVSTGSVTAAGITDATAIGRTILTAADATAVKTALLLSKNDVGLGNVDNTSDLDKPISTDMQNALDTKADASAVGSKLLLIDNAAALPAGTPAGVVVVVKS